MSFQSQPTALQSTFQGQPVHVARALPGRRARAQVRVQATGVIESLPTLIQAANLGFLCASIPGAAKGARDLKNALAEPNPPKPLTTAGKQLVVLQPTIVFGGAGALIGFLSEAYHIHLGMAPQAAWSAGAVSGLGLFAALVRAVEQRKIANPPPRHNDVEAEVDDARCNEDACQVTDSLDADDAGNAIDNVDDNDVSNDPDAP